MPGIRLPFVNHFKTTIMFFYIIALFWALINPAHNHTNSNTSNEQVTVMDDTGGETGTIPPKPQKP
jgi:hypothetical protein